MAEEMDITEYPQTSIADLEDMILDEDGSPVHYKLKDDSQDAIDNYHMPGTYLDVEKWKTYLSMINNLSSIYSGHGPFGNTFQNFLSRLDIYGTSMVPLNVMNTGFTFITRPRLNLSGANLRQHPLMNTLYNTDPGSVSFMIRALLDTHLCSGRPLFNSSSSRSKYSLTQEENQFMHLANQSGLIDPLNPFFIPICNGLTGISGFPDFSIQEETTEGDVHSGDYTFVKGGDMNNRTQELSLDLRDVPGSILLSIFYYWTVYMALQAKGVVMSYPDDIYEQRLNYTVSIYRFVMDNTKQNILWWCKATGCFPKSAPIGALFNISEGETAVTSAMKFSIPFVANDVKVNEPGALLDFNMLMLRYTAGMINDPSLFKPIDQYDVSQNFSALPYITARVGEGVRLEWRTHPFYQDVVPRHFIEKIPQSFSKLHTEMIEAKNLAMQNAGALDYSWANEVTSITGSDNNQ